MKFAYPFSRAHVFFPCSRSSFGKVYKALHHASNQIMAIKIVPLEDDTGDVEREINHLQECECPNIVSYHGSFLHEERLWIMMEYCEGSSLLDIMAATGRCLTQQQVAASLSGCVEALLYLHSRSKVHRDVKAGNLLLSSDGVVKLADFGVAASINAASRRRTVIGTPFWMAPEVITCRRGPSGGGSAGYDELADVWSLGITAIELAEGQPPHSTVSPLTAIFLIPTLPAPTFAEPARWSDDFAKFVASCLVKEPEKRASSARLKANQFIADGATAAMAGVLRSLMSSSREPLRAFRDKSAAKSAAKAKLPAPADGTVKDLKEIGDNQYGGTLGSPRPSRDMDGTPGRHSFSRSSREAPARNGSFTMPRPNSNSPTPQSRRAERPERLSNGGSPSSPLVTSSAVGHRPSELEKISSATRPPRLDVDAASAKIDFDAIANVARALASSGTLKITSADAPGLCTTGTLQSEHSGEALLPPPPAATRLTGRSAAHVGRAAADGVEPPPSLAGLADRSAGRTTNGAGRSMLEARRADPAPSSRPSSEPSPVSVSDLDRAPTPAASSPSPGSAASQTLKPSTMLFHDPGSASSAVLVNQSGTVAIKDGPAAGGDANPLAAALRAAEKYTGYNGIGVSSSDNGHAANGAASGAANGADATMLVREQSGDVSTMVIKPEAMSAVLRAGERERADNSGTMLLTPSGASGIHDEQPAFMRHMFGPNSDGNGHGAAGRAGEASGGLRSRRMSRDIELGPLHLGKDWSQEELESSRRESGNGNGGASGRDGSVESERARDSRRSSSLASPVFPPSSAPAKGGGEQPRPRVSISSSSSRDFAAMGIDTLTKELATLSAHMERDIGKVYRKYERLERTINAERDRKITALHAAAADIS